MIIIQLGKLSSTAYSKINEIPVVAEAISNGSIQTLDRRTIRSFNVDWSLSRDINADLEANVAIWHEVLDWVTKNIKREKDLDKFIIIAPNTPTIVESRNRALQEMSTMEGIGPKRLDTLKRMFEVWIPTMFVDPKDIRASEKAAAEALTTSIRTSRKSEFTTPRRVFCRWMKI